MEKHPTPSSLLRSLTHRTITAKQDKKYCKKGTINRELIRKQTKEFIKSGGKIQYLPIGETGVEI
jgi:hypothetical protein